MPDVSSLLILFVIGNKIIKILPIISWQFDFYNPEGEQNLAYEVQQANMGVMVRSPEMFANKK